MTTTTSSDDLVNRNEVRKLSDILGDDHREAIKIGVIEYLNQFGHRLIKALIESEVRELCGPRYEHDKSRNFTRHGYQDGSVTALGGGRDAIERPRVRNTKTNKEAVLQTYEACQDRALLEAEALAHLNAGVSARQFEKVISRGIEKGGVSPSSFSRRVIRSAQASLELFETRRWDKTRFVALLFDGVKIGRCMVIACIGVDLSGKKHVLSTHPGATENERVCRDLIRKLIEKGLNPDGNYLFVVDGSKALRKAITDAFGQEAVFQRCQEHKIRDVIAYVPFNQRQALRAQLQAAYNTRSYTEASRRLQKIRSGLGKYEQAKNSLTEGLEPSLTLHRLGIWGGLKDSLRTTNIIESTFATLRKKTHQVTNWQDEAQINRWTAHGLLSVEQRYRRVPGHRTLTRLRKKLDAIYSASQSPSA